MTFLSPALNRRQLVEAIILAGGAAAFDMPAWAEAPRPDAHRDDWRWLVGNWDVWHRRLKERLAGSDDWAEFGGKSACWLTLGGLGTIDDNILDLPGGDQSNWNRLQLWDCIPGLQNQQWTYDHAKWKTLIHSYSCH